MTDSELREKFEKWASNKDLMLARFSATGDYVDYLVYIAWEAVEAIYQAGAASARATQWISVKERLPEVGVEVLLHCWYASVDCLEVQKFSDSERLVWKDRRRLAIEPAYWQPIPAAPEKQQTPVQFIATSDQWRGYWNSHAVIPRDQVLRLMEDYAAAPLPEKPQTEET